MAKKDSGSEMLLSDVLDSIRADLLKSARERTEPDWKPLLLALARGRLPGRRLRGAGRPGALHEAQLLRGTPGRS